jgi:hypothetical protein
MELNIVDKIKELHQIQERKEIFANRITEETISSDEEWLENRLADCAGITPDCVERIKAILAERDKLNGNSE